MRLTTLSLTLLLSLVTLAGHAETPVAPTGPVVLSIVRDTAATPITLDMAMLEALPETEFKTTTIWTEGEQTFDGVYLRTLLDSYGISGKSLTVTAINDYSVKIPMDEIRENEALLAYKRNGAPMSVRDKGPLWVVYPYDSSDELRNEVIYSRSVWQVVSLTAEK